MNDLNKIFDMLANGVLPVASIYTTSTGKQGQVLSYRRLGDGTSVQRWVDRHDVRMERITAYLEKRALRNSVSKSANNNKKGARL